MELHPMPPKNVQTLEIQMVAMWPAPALEGRVRGSRMTAFYPGKDLQLNACATGCYMSVTGGGE